MRPSRPIRLREPLVLFLVSSIIFTRGREPRTPPGRRIFRHALAFSDTIVVTSWRDDSPEGLIEWLGTELSPAILKAMGSGVFLRVPSRTVSSTRTHPTSCLVRPWLTHMSGQSRPIGLEFILHQLHTTHGRLPPRMMD